ncbi:hypothetical protein [Halocatena marina]|uniref:hypothetical protein n=1 Tax=Halocatena marina TaxID=2934937 RepID=UPI00222491AC|nr:hypothetical protein [Halocatena marina]
MTGRICGRASGCLYLCVVHHSQQHMAGRKNAMLTTEDRRWLTGEKTYEGEHAKQQRYQRRRDIRERVYNSILDFTILFQQLEETEREKLFGHLSDDGTQWDIEDEAFEAGIRDALAFLLYNIGVTKPLSTDKATSSTPVAEQLITDAIYHAGRRDDYLVETVELNITATHLPLSNVLDDLEAGTTLSPARLRVLMESDRVDTAEIQECVRRMIFEDD